MAILALIIAAIAIQIVLAGLVIKTLWVQGDAAQQHADPRPSLAQDFGAVAPPPAPSAVVPLIPRRGTLVRLPGGAGARYVDGRV